jgi:ketosteroid isomerase-like protein
MRNSAAGGDLKEISRASSALLSAVNSSNVDGVLAVWRADGTMMPPHHPAVQGHAAIRDYFSDLFARRRLNFVFTASHIRVAGDVAFEQLSFRATSTPIAGGDPIQDTGKGLHIYSRESDRTWKLLLDIWNSDL